MNIFFTHAEATMPCKWRTWGGGGGGAEKQVKMIAGRCYMGTCQIGNEVVGEAPCTLRSVHPAL